MASIDSGLPPLVPDVLRTEYRQVVGGNALDKPTFGERFKMALAKFGSIFGKIAGAVAPFFGPFGMIGSQVAYGLSRFSDGAMAKMQAKRENQANLDAQASQLNPANFFAPGFSGFDSSANTQPQLQVAPFARGYEQEIVSTLTKKGEAAVQSVNSI